LSALARKYWWTTGAIAYGAALLASSSIPAVLGRPINENLSDGLILVLILTLAVAAWYTSRRHGLGRHAAGALHLFAWAFVAMLVGDTGFLLAQNGRLGKWPLGMEGYVLYVLLTSAAFLRLPRVPTRPAERWKLILDAGTIAIASAIVTTYVVISAGAWIFPYSTPWLSIIYPLANAVLVFAIATAAVRSPFGSPTSGFMLLLSGSVLEILADVVYSISAHGIAAVSAEHVADGIHIVSLVVLTAGIERWYRSDEMLAEGLDREPPASAYESIVPYIVPVGVYAFVLIVALRQGATPIVLALLGAAPITALLAARGMIDMREARRLLAERTARASEARFRALVQHASDAIMILDLEGVIRFASPTTTRVFGVRPEGLIGVALPSLAELGDALIVTTLLDEARRKAGTPVDATWRARIADGEARIIESVATDLSTVPLIGGLVINARDVTEHQALHERLGHAHRLEAVGQLAGGVAHDFNNILTAISGNAELALAELPTGAAAGESLREIRQAVARATSLTRQLLAFSRKQVLRPRVLRINEVVTGCERMLARLIGEDIELKVIARPDLPPIMANSGQLEQALVNLVVNSRDAMPDGGEIRIETGSISLAADDVRDHPGLVPGNYVWLAVRDTGLGMDEATRARAFEPFFTTKAAGLGTGLGLATVYGIVKQSGGYVYASSSPEHGSVFTMYFPPSPVGYGEEEEFGIDEDKASLNRETTVGAETSTGTGATILVVEDERTVRAAIAQALARRGYNVLQAVDGADGVAVGARYAGQIDLVVSDVIMPHLTGPAMMDALRVGRPGLRALFISGYAAPQLRGKLAEVAATLLEKPFTLTTLVDRVQTMLAAPGEHHAPPHGERRAAAVG